MQCSFSSVVSATPNLEGATSTCAFHVTTPDHHPRNNDSPIRPPAPPTRPTETRGGVHLYDHGMLSPSVAELLDAVKRVEIAVDGDDLAAVAQARELLLVKTMEPLRAFD